ncbi:MAG: discoidin domain-containing protein [Pirellulales bacterium]|nr:discoidin domain-containing protein [Pirellulales bacterium]
MSTTTTNAAPTNLATAGTATASSQYDVPYAPGNANDGSRDGSVIWHSANDSTNPAWWQVDLGSDQYLDRVQIFPRNFNQGTVENFTIDVLNSANVNMFSQSYGGSTADVAWGTNSMRGVLGQTVRITRNDADPDAMTFAEFEVFGQNSPILQNLAINRPVTATAAAFGTTPENAVDGNIDGNFSHGSIYHSDPGVTPHSTNFWQVELAADSEIDYVTIYARTDDLSNNPNLQLTLLAADGTTVVDTTPFSLGGNDLGAARYDFTHDFANNPTGKFIRIQSTSDGPDDILELGEVEVFGTVVPEPTSAFLLSGLSLFVVLWMRKHRSAGVACLR